MTVVAARRDPQTGLTFIGADRRAREDGDRLMAPAEKIWRACGAVFGAAGNYAFIQRLQRWMKDRGPVETRDAVLELAEEIWTRLKDERWGDHQPTLELLVVTSEGVFVVDGDGCASPGFAWGVAIGAGGFEAAAVLFDRQDESAEEAVRRALRTACARCSSCGDGVDLFRVRPAVQALEQVSR